MPLPPRAFDRPINPEIERLLYQVNVIRQEAEGLVWGLNEDQFNWSPASGVWSVAQCFDHLNLTNKGMIGKFEQAIQSGKSAGLTSAGPFTYGFFARWFLKLTQPPVRRRFTAPGPIVPAATKKNIESVVQEWNQTHDRIAELMREASGLDLAKIKMSSPVASWLKYALGAGFWICTAHDRRHLWQIRQLRNDKRFPV